MSKKTRIMVLLFLIASFCVACGKTDLNVKSEFTYDSGKLNESEDSNTVETEQVVKLVEPLELGKVIAQYVGNAAPNIDLNDCDTFTQIIDKKLENGMGWTNVDFRDTNVLMVCSKTYDHLEGNMAGTDAAVYVYKDGMPAELGKVGSGGTDYPLAKHDSYLYTASDHWICKNIVTEEGIEIVEGAMIEYDSNGKETFYYASQEMKANHEISSTEIDELMNHLYEERENAEVIYFDTIQK